MSAGQRMLRDVLDQPHSLAGVLRHQLGAGRAALEQAAAALSGARRVIVTGMGASYHAAWALVHQLNVQGRPCVPIETGELLHFGGLLLQDAVVLLVSRSGETVEALRLLPLLRSAGAFLIGVTNEPGSTLARAADCALIVASRADEAVAVQSYTGTALTMLLLAAILEGDDRASEANQVPAAVSAALERWSAHDWNPFLSGASVVYVLGRGASYGSACEGALLFHETAKLPAVALASGGFRHGPVEVVERGFRAILFVSEHTPDLDEALQANLERMGGEVVAIANGGGYFSPVAEIVPVQLAAYHAALLRGFTPGQFRYVSLVTASETDFRSDAR